MLNCCKESQVPSPFALFQTFCLSSPCLAPGKIKPLEVAEAELNAVLDAQLERFKLEVLEEHYPGGESDVVAACSAQQLLVEDVVVAVHKTKDTVVSVDSVNLGMAIFSAAAGDSETATAAQLCSAFQDDAVQAQVKLTQSNDLKALVKATEEKVADFLESLATSPENKAAKQCSRSDWQAYLRRLRAEKLLYFQQVALLRGRHYMGLGLTPGGAKSCLNGAVPVCYASENSCGPWLWRTLFWRGFWSDFAYFTRNNHPIGVFFSDPRHPYSPKCVLCSPHRMMLKCLAHLNVRVSLCVCVCVFFFFSFFFFVCCGVCMLRSERAADFAASFCTSFFGAALMLITGENGFIAKFFISALFVSIPTAIIKKLCYYLFAQPCLLLDRSKSGGCKECCVDCCSKMVTSLGMGIVCVWSTAFFTIGLVLWLQSEAADLLFWATGLAQFWVLWFMNMLAMQFYPFQFGLPVLKLFRKLTCGLVRFGQWHIERDEVLTVVREKIKTRGRFHFATPGSPREADADNAASGADKPGEPGADKAAVISSGDPGDAEVKPATSGSGEPKEGEADAATSGSGEPSEADANAASSTSGEPSEAGAGAVAAANGAASGEIVTNALIEESSQPQQSAPQI